ncbi:hypothetical protein [Pseudomonas sp. 22 E 5]|nr:hypothetical protein [Pseudomonas sp. 22 E 5]
MGVFVITDRGFHGDRLFSDLQYLADFILRHFHAFAQLFRGRFATHFLQHLPGNTVELVDGLDHVHRNTDGAGLVGDRASDRLTDPPGGISRELVAATVFEFIHSLHQADIAFLDQIEELQATVGVLLGNGDHQTQVRFNHLFLRAAGLGLTDRHATVDVLDLGNRQTGFGLQCLQLLLATDDVRLQATNGFGVFRLALGQCVGPAFIYFVARELTQEVGTRHARVTDTELHDRTLLCTQTLQGAANPLNQAFELLRHQLDRHEQLSQGQQLGDCLLVGATVLFQGLAGDFHLIGNRTETLGSDDWVWTAFNFIFVVAAGFSVVVFGVVVRFRSLGIDWWRHFGGRRRNAVVRVDVATQHVGQAATFGGNAGVLGENMVNRAREVRDCAHHFTDALFDTLGDFDFAFACQQLDGTHFTHIHAHRVGGTTDIGLHSSQRGCRFFSGSLVGIGVRQHKGILIWRSFEYVDPHVVNHADDVFHLLWI